MKALPNVTMLVVGHPDQLDGTPASMTLAGDRAAAVAAYLNAKGIDGNRLASRANTDGEVPALDGMVSEALNGRIDVVFYGLLAS
jgi:hypothetical protein